ncbi:MAG TPA: hypothetical protein VEV85_03525 [Bryobacteraceae bacterium]|nr:hypothetical protein [Bryobacteraceae bacterium]
MKESYRNAIVTMAAALGSVLLLAQAPAPGPAPQDGKNKAKDDAKAKNIAQAFALNARTLTLFDREGKQLNTVGPRGMYGQAIFSPDGTRIAISKADLEKENQDLWIMDAATGNSVQITAGKSREFANSPAWSPDGRQIAYAALRGGSFQICRKPADGTGAEEVLYALGGVASVNDWSPDGAYLSFFSSDLGGSVVYALPVNASGERKPIEIFRSPKQVQAGRISPDGRLLTYMSNETGKNEVYVRAFDPAGSGNAPKGGPWKISDQGGFGSVWRKDGKELYYLALDRSLMIVPVTMSPELQFGKAKLLFRLPESIGLGAGDVRRDGERFMVAVPPPQLRQLTVFDRQGKVVKTVAEPGIYVQPHLSPNGTKIAVMRNDPKTSNQDIWTYDIETGKGYAVTSDTWPHNAPIWSPDGTHVLYVSTRDNYAGIYRKNWDGTGQEELLFRYTPGAGMVMTDASPDGKFLSFYTGVLALVPLNGTDPLARKALDWLRDEYDNFGGRFSPDGRYIAYLSNPDDPMTADIFIRLFDAGKPDTSGPGPVVRVTNNGMASGMISWREDAKEMYFLTRDWEVMAVDIQTTPTLRAGMPKLLFKLPGPLVGNPPQWKNVSRDGQQFVFAMPASQR